MPDRNLAQFSAVWHSGKQVVGGGLLLALTACSSFLPPAYQCALNESPQAKCASMQDAYTAAKKPNPPTTRSPLERATVFDAAAVPAAASEPKAAPETVAVASSYPEPGTVGMPVFKQPRVFRPWVAPYVDADGNLRSGEYVYFSTPGEWNYGTLRQPGSASALFGPSRRTNLGFKPAPVTTPPVAATAPRPAGTPAGTPRPESTDGITQPYQRLTQ